jgi:hypothetical protein
MRPLRGIARRLLTAAACLLVAAGAGALAAPAAAAASNPAAGLQVRGLSWFTDGIAVVHLDGLLVNAGRQAVESPAAVLDLFDAHGRLLRSETATGALGVLYPGRQVGFDKQLTNPLPGFDHARVRRTVGQPRVTSPSIAFTVVVTHVVPTSPTDAQIMRGTARNDEPYTVDYIKIIVTFLKADGSVAWVANTQANAPGPYVAPGETVPWAVPGHPDNPAYTSFSIAYDANETGAAVPVRYTTLPLPRVTLPTAAGTGQGSVLGHAPVLNSRPDPRVVPHLPPDFGQTAAAVPRQARDLSPAAAAVGPYVTPRTSGAQTGTAPLDIPVKRTAQFLLVALVALAAGYLLVRLVVRRVRSGSDLIGR